MLRDWFFTLSKRTRRVIGALAALVVLAVAGYFGWRFASVNIPDSFDTQRAAASDYARTIADSLKEIPNILVNVQQLELQGKDTDAISLLATEFQKNEDAKSAAVKLSGALEAMAKDIPNVRPKSAGESALVAISSETALIYKLVEYNDQLAQLLGLLRERIVGKGGATADVNKLVDAINANVDSINSLNAQFVQSMNEFDKGVN